MSNRVFHSISPPVAAAVCLTALASPAVLTAQGPFACTGEAYIVQDSAVPGIDGQLTQIDQSQSPFTFVDVGTPQVEYNNIGFNPADGFIYGVALTEAGNAGLLLVAGDGSVTHLMAVSGMCNGGTVSFPGNVRFDAPASLRRWKWSPPRPDPARPATTARRAPRTSSAPPSR